MPYRYSDESCAVEYQDSDGEWYEIASTGEVEGFLLCEAFTELEAERDKLRAVIEGGLVVADRQIAELRGLERKLMNVPADKSTRRTHAATRAGDWATVRIAVESVADVLRTAQEAAK